ncbi:DUF6411 family protein [Streptomyces uncialis]
MPGPDRERAGTWLSRPFHEASRVAVARRGRAGWRARVKR